MTETNSHKQEKNKLGKQNLYRELKKTIDILAEIRADISSIKHNTIILFFKRNILKKKSCKLKIY